MRQADYSDNEQRSLLQNGAKLEENQINYLMDLKSKIIRDSIVLGTSTLLTFIGSFLLPYFESTDLPLAQNAYITLLGSSVLAFCYQPIRLISLENKLEEALQTAEINLDLINNNSKEIPKSSNLGLDRGLLN